MNQKTLIWRALKQAGVLESDDAQLQKFVKFLHEHPTQCWGDIVSDFRKQFYGCFDAVVPTLAAIENPRIRNTLIKYLDPSEPKERKLLTKLAQETDPQRDPVAIKQLAQLQDNEVNKVLRRQSLPEELQPYLEK